MYGQTFKIRSDLHRASTQTLDKIRRALNFTYHSHPLPSWSITFGYSSKSGPHPVMAPSQAHDLTEGPPLGPHPSHIQIAKPYVFQQTVQECISSTEAKDDGIRLQGVLWIDSVRKAMHLPVRTYNAAVVYYLKYRLAHPDNNGFIDAAAAALFAACKIEDTLKKSKEILCAAYNLKLPPAEQLTPDDAVFENHSKSIIGLERLMLEASGFDFRNRYPQRLLLKIAKHYRVQKETVGKTAFNMSLDLYRTFAPLKQTTATMAVACVELSARIFEQNISELEAGRPYKKLRITRAEVMETLLDLLDLYTHHRTTTVVGVDHILDTFINIRIVLNQEASANRYPRYTQSIKKKTSSNGSKNSTTNGTRDHREAAPKSVISPREDLSKELRSPQSAVSANGGLRHPGLREGTVRFMLDPQRARDEKQAVAEFFRPEEEEYEIEVERIERGGERGFEREGERRGERTGERRRDSAENSSHDSRAHNTPDIQMGLNGHRVIVGGDFERRMVAGSARRQAYEEMRERERYDDWSWVEDDSERRERGKRQNLEERWREREPLDDQKLAYYAANGIPTPAQQKETSDRKRDASQLTGPPAQAPQGPKKAKPLPEWQKDITRKKTKKKSKKQRRAIYV